jgi:diketogulonate reductase-like aldo/keto reductase
MMPVIGLGTYLFKDEKLLKEVVKSAILDYRYRLIDTATEYGNEKFIGDALQECFAQGIKREDIFITTKLWIDDKENVEKALRESIENLKCDYIDLYLIHWMNPAIDPETNEIKKTPLY